VPKVLQRVLDIGVTGRMDEATVAAARKRERRALVHAICDERLRFLQGLKTWPVFGRGWARRVGEVRSAALALADDSAARAPQRPATATSGKGVVPINDAARKSTAAGAIASGGIAAQQSAESGADWIIIIIIVAVALAIAGGAWIFWRWHQKRRQEAPA
jgi:lysozyme family protein